MKLSAFWGGGRFSQIWLNMTPAGFSMKLSAFWGHWQIQSNLTNYDSGQFFDELERFLAAVSSLVSFD